MAQFSKKERLLASMLSNMPFLKWLAKYFYSYFCYLVYRKSNNLIICANRLEINRVLTNINKEDFGGYYDHPTMRNGKVIGMIPSSDTNKGICRTTTADLYVADISDGCNYIACATKTINWQQGCRAIWINDDSFIFNDYDSTGSQYVSKVFSLKEKDVVRIYNMPVQDLYDKSYFLSVNVDRISLFHPEYGYMSKGRLCEGKILDIDHDGIWRIEMESGDCSILFSIRQVLDVNPNPEFNFANHILNHIMISPDGDKFIFLHRYFIKGVRHERLMVYDYNQLRVISNEGYVSHCYWLDNCRIVSYLRHNGVNAYYIINVMTGEYEELSILKSLNMGDGHPSCFKNWMIFDSYPDKSRMQNLVLYNIDTGKYYKLIEIFHPMKFFGNTRCDLHPRFSDSGNSITFDSVFEGKRHQYYIDLRNFLSL